MKLINSLINKDTSCLPIWFMRQAGRYLPEFQKIRSLNQDFIKLCLNSNLSSEISLQPLLRYNLDAAIIFSDILMVPYGLGQEVKFQKNFGPILSNFNLDTFLENDEKQFSKKLKPVYDAIKKTRQKLEKNKSLISFVGAPWTLIIYMLGLKKERNILDKELLKIKKNEIKLILNTLNKFLCLHIKNQIEAGADVVQIFDSWAGLIDENDLDDYCYNPNLSIVNFCKNNNIPVICFPKGLDRNYLNFYKHVKPDGINIDFDLDPEWARKNLDGACIQGGMNPKVLLSDDQRIFKEAEKYLKIFKDYPYIFNLGHGLLPQTNPDKVEKLIKFIRERK
jgi:uroporphyrinogen decarboxylase